MFLFTSDISLWAFSFFWSLSLNPFVISFWFQTTLIFLFSTINNWSAAQRFSKKTNFVAFYADQGIIIWKMVAQRFGKCGEVVRRTRRNKLLRDIWFDLLSIHRQRKNHPLAGTTYPYKSPFPSIENHLWKFRNLLAPACTSGTVVSQFLRVPEQMRWVRKATFTWMPFAFIQRWVPHPSQVMCAKLNQEKRSSNSNS